MKKVLSFILISFSFSFASINLNSINPINIGNTPTVNIGNALIANISGTPTVTLSSGTQVNIKMINTSGDVQGISLSSFGKQKVIAEDHTSAIASGEEPDHFVIRIVGINPDVNNAFEDVWFNGGLYVTPPTPGIQMVIKSTSASDAFTGTGVKQIHIHYLDYPTMDEKTVTYNLNGLSGVTTNETNIYRIQHAHAVAVGSGGSAAGEITIANVAISIQYARIQTGQNVTQKVTWTVPAGRTAYIAGWNASSSAAASGHYCKFYLQTTASIYGVAYPGIYHIVDMVQLEDNAIDIKFNVPIKLPEKTDIRVRVIGDASNSGISAQAHFDGWYE